MLYEDMVIPFRTITLNQYHAMLLSNERFARLDTSYLPIIVELMIQVEAKVKQEEMMKFFLNNEYHCYNFPFFHGVIVLYLLDLMIGIRNSIFSSSIYGGTTLTTTANVSMSSWNSMSQNNALRWEIWLKTLLNNSINLVHHSIYWSPWEFDIVINISLQTPWWTSDGSPRSPSLAIIFSIGMWHV